MRSRGLPLDRVEDRALGLRVDGGERIVEDEDLRLPDERARERDALLLTARELHAALADDGVEPLGQRQRLLEHLRLARGVADLRDARRASRGRRARSRCCARPSSRRGTRPAARSRWPSAPTASGSSQTSTPSMRTRARAASAAGARGASRASSCPSPCARRWRATRPGATLKRHVVEHLAARRTRSVRCSTRSEPPDVLRARAAGRRRPRAPRRRRRAGARSRRGRAARR